MHMHKHEVCDCGRGYVCSLLVTRLAVRALDWPLSFCVLTSCVESVYSIH